MLSVVIPTLNAAATLPRTVASLAEGRAYISEIVVSDGGSSDGTVEAARSAGAQVLEAPRGRGAQLRAGAEAAGGDWLLFLHADTALAPGWTAAVLGFVGDQANVDRAGYFRFALDDASPPARRIERWVHWRCRALALPYGDQGLLLSVGLYRAIGGFALLPLMEDVDLVRRLGRRHLACLEATAITSAERYRRDGYWRRPLRNLTCLGLYLAGVSPQRIAKLYA